MSFEQRWEQQRLSQLAYMRTRMAALDCGIGSLRKDIEFWSEPAKILNDEERARLLASLNRLLERALHDKEYYRARLARHEGFDIVRVDIH
jgi:hypothetical protein